MIDLIKSTNITDQKFKLLTFYILNLLDILFTQFLIFNMPDVFVEINPALAPIINSYQSLLLKVIVPIIIMIYWNFRYLKASEKERKRANLVLNIILIAFASINLLHVFNLTLYIFIS